MNAITDKELLELAAKAAGIGHPGGEHSVYNDGRLWDCDRCRWWNPLSDDGDALRLAADLNLDVNHYPKSREVAAVQHRQNIGVYSRSIERITNDKHYSLRRAIVRAAAQIGKDMK